MFDVATLTRPFFAEAQEISRGAAAEPSKARRSAKKPNKRDDDDDDGPSPTAGAVVARLFPFFRPRPWGFATA